MRTRWPHFSRIGVRVADGKLIYELLGQGRLLIESFNGEPQASLPDFAYACGSPLNENAYNDLDLNR